MSRKLALALVLYSLIAGCSHGGSGSFPIPYANNSTHVLQSGSNGLAIRQSNTGYGALGTSFTVSLTSAPTAGDLILVFFVDDSNFVFGDQDGWTIIDEYASGASTALSVAWHVAQSTDGTSYTFNTSSGHRGAYVIYELTGADTTHPIDSGAYKAYPPGTTSFTTPAALPTSTNTLPIAVLAELNDSDTWTDQTGWTRDLYQATFSIDALHGAITTNETSHVSETSTLSKASSYDGFADIVLINPAPNVSYELPVYEYIGAGSNGCAGADAGAADAYVFWGLEQCGLGSITASLANCPGKISSSCQIFYYTDFAQNNCSAAYQTALLTWANSNDENAYFHYYDGPRSSSYRYEPNAFDGSSSCASYGGTNTTSFSNNLSDTATANWIYSNIVSTTAYFPVADQGLVLDNNGPGAGQPISYYCQQYSGILCTTEYGEPAQAWTACTGMYCQTTVPNALAALGVMVNNLCQGSCTPIVDNYYVGTACNAYGSGSVSDGHCMGNSAGASGGMTYDNQLRTQELCSTLTHPNLYAFVAERAIYSSGEFLTNTEAYRITSLINTAATLMLSHGSDNCKNLRLVDLEQPSAAAGVRTMQAALRWLVPSTDQTPDFIILWRFTYGETTSELALFPEDFLVPYDPEQPLTAYQFNGATIDDGSGCPADGDTGGAVGLVVYCSGGIAVYCEQYRHLAYAQSGTEVDEGPAMACINPSDTAVNFASMTFKGDPFSTYKHMIDLNGDEISSTATLYYAPGRSEKSPCTNATYCNGTLDFTGTIPTSLPADSGILLTSQ
jgi:hypothetical protein